MKHKKMVFSLYTPVWLVVAAPVLMIAISFACAHVMQLLAKWVVTGIQHKPYYPIPFEQVWLVLSALSMVLLYRIFANERRNMKNPQMDFIRAVLEKTPAITMEHVGVELYGGGYELLFLHARTYSKKEIERALDRFIHHVLGEGYHVEILNRGYLVALERHGKRLPAVKDFTYKEFFVKRFIQSYLIARDNKPYCFFDVDWFIRNSAVQPFDDFEITEADVDDIFNPPSQPVRVERIAVPVQET